VTLKLSEPQVKELVEQLDTPAKERLLQDLERTVHKSEWGALFAEIDRRRRGRRVPSMQEIVKEVKAVRKELYERSQRGR
jgi:hypothetical protein